MKKAFTFAELMISLVIIAIITAILYPTVADLAPNNNEHLFKNTYKTIELTISDIVGSTEEGTVTTTPQALCEQFQSRLNTTTATNCTIDANNLVANMQTTNGVRWLFIQDNTDANIYVDVNATNNNDAGNTGCAGNADYSTTINVANGGWGVDGDGVNLTCDKTSQDTFKIIVSQDGKVEPFDSVAIRHLNNSN